MLSAGYASASPIVTSWVHDEISDASASYIARLRAPGALLGLELPVLPEVAQSVWLELERPNGDARLLANILRRDAAFAAHILRHANSPVYSGRTPITSLQQAVSRLGVRTLGEITVLVACKTRAFQVRGHEQEVRDIFSHSLLSALWAREVARMRRLDVDSSFLGGLLHDVGRPTLIQALVDLSAQPGALCLSSSELLVVVSDLHVEVGAAILAAWKIPERITLAVREHHRTDFADLPPECAVLALADLLAHGGDADRELHARASAHPATVALNLYPEEVDVLLAKQPHLRDQARALL
jgi:putative nucleotidyltransferase with HDIG domain